jgi:hypothetical protein
MWDKNKEFKSSKPTKAKRNTPRYIVKLSTFLELNSTLGFLWDQEKMCWYRTMTLL